MKKSAGALAACVLLASCTTSTDPFETSTADHLLGQERLDAHIRERAALLDALTAQIDQLDVDLLAQLGALSKLKSESDRLAAKASQQDMDIEYLRLDIARLKAEAAESRRRVVESERRIAEFRRATGMTVEEHKALSQEVAELRATVDSLEQAVAQRRAQLTAAVGAK